MDSPGRELPQFAPTRWSVVLAARDPSQPQAQEALSTLCQAYWYPLYAYVRRAGHSPQDAQDLTQEFFARLLEKGYLVRLRREGGKFRSFLLTALKRFLANEWDRAKAQRRGGGRTPISLDAAEAESRYDREPVHDLTPEKIYERRWAQMVLDGVLEQLRAEYSVHGKTHLFEALSESLSRPRGEVRYADIAGKLGSTEAAVKMAVQRLRSRYRQLLRAEIAHTTSSPEEVEDEIRHLFSSFG